MSKIMSQNRHGPWQDRSMLDGQNYWVVSDLLKQYRGILKNGPPK